MISIPAADTYLNARSAWVTEFMNKLPNDDRAWREHFHAWLAEQGAEIHEAHQHGTYSTDPLGVALFHDSVVFFRDHDATVFILKWS